VSSRCRCTARERYTPRRFAIELQSIIGHYEVLERIVRFFAYLAGRAGRAEGEGVRIPLSLQQRRIEEILGAGHTQATTAFRGLVEGGVLVHDADGWQFRRDCLDAPASSAPNRFRHASSSAPNSMGLRTTESLPLTRAGS
jgi:hypothetical protein